MENQHKHIKGYRDLTKAEIDLMNEIKAQGEALDELCSRLQAMTAIVDGRQVVDGRWVSIGKTHLQQGIMALVRAVAQPTTF